MIETQASVFKLSYNRVGQVVGFLSGLLFFFTSSFMNNAQAHSIVQYWENRSNELGNDAQAGLILEPRISFYSTSSNFNNSGQTEALANHASVNRTDEDFNLAYRLNPRLNLFGRLSFVSSRLQNTEQAKNSVFGFSDQLLGANYVLSENAEGTRFFFQADLILPFYQNDHERQAGAPFIGDGSYDFTAGIFAEIAGPSRQIKLEMGTGMTFRSYGYATAVPWSLLLKSSESHEGVIWQIGLRGQLSLSNDHTATSTDSEVGAAGSDLINAINPSWTLAQGTLGYQNQNLQSLYFTIANPIIARHSPNGLQVSVGLKLPFDVTHSEAPDPAMNERSSAAATELKAKAYNLDANILSMNDQLFVCKINKGSSDDIKKGQIFDIFENDQLLARAQVLDVKNNESVLNVLEYYQEKWIERGLSARRITQ